VELIIGILFFIIGNVFAWFQFNSQFVWDWWRDKPFVSVAIFAMPMSLCFWHAVKNIVDSTGLLWSSRLIGFGVSTFVFAVLTYFIAKESIFTFKTLSSIFLACLIIFIQIYWK
tara:strand:- start:5063 stop:5404 length:342 start_codon:yes stop_codon:yes gene_type:complete